MIDPLVTVLMAVWNGEAYLREAVDSILGQTFDDFELLIVDDCSTDSTPAILAEYAEADSRVRVLRNERNMTASPSLNRGLDHARGKYIARHDADDSSHPERLARQVAYMESHPDCLLLGTGCIITDEEGKPKREISFPTSDFAVRSGFLFGNVFAHGSIMFRPRPEYRYTDEIICSDDYDLWTRIVLDGEAANLQEPLYYWREHEGCISIRKKQLQDDERDMIRERYRADLVKRGDLSVFLNAYLNGAPNAKPQDPELRQVLLNADPASGSADEKRLRHELIRQARLTGRQTLADWSLLCRYGRGATVHALTRNIRQRMHGRKPTGGRD